MAPEIKNDPDFWSRVWKTHRETFDSIKTTTLDLVEHFVPSYYDFETNKFVSSTKCKCGSDMGEKGYCAAYEKEKEWLEIRDKLDKEYGPLYGTRRL